MNENRPSGIEASELEELDASIGSLLLRTLPRLFGISEEEAYDALAQAFHSYVLTVPTKTDPAKWIAAAACTVARAKQRARVPAVAPPVDPDVAEAEVVRTVVYARGLQRLPCHEREAVALHTTEGKTYWEIAAAMGITPVSAKKLVGRAAAKLRRWARDQE